MSSSNRQELSQLFSEMNREAAPELSAPAAPIPFGCPADPATQAEISGSHLDAGTSPLRLDRPQPADGLAAPGPVTPGAASQPEWPIDWRAIRADIDAMRRLPAAAADGIRDELADIRALAAALVHTAQDLVARIDRMDPTPGALAAAVTDLDAYRR